MQMKCTATLISAYKMLSTKYLSTKNICNINYRLVTVDLQSIIK